MNPRTETLEGYVVDLACLRKYPQDELAERARSHTKACALMGHCLESGYGLVDEDGRVALLDMRATPLIFDALRETRQERGIKLRAVREMAEKEMRTVRVEATG